MKKPKFKVSEQHRWQIYLLRSTPAQYLGMVEAPDEAGAMDNAIVELKGKRCCDHTSAGSSADRHRSGDQAARRTLVCSAQAHGRSSSIFWAGQPLTSLARISAR
jgi:hypothetical protein